MKIKTCPVEASIKNIIDSQKNLDTNILSKLEAVPHCEMHYAVRGLLAQKAYRLHPAANDILFNLAYETKSKIQSHVPHNQKFTAILKVNDSEIVAFQITTDLTTELKERITQLYLNGQDKILQTEKIEVIAILEGHSAIVE